MIINHNFSCLKSIVKLLFSCLLILNSFSSFGQIDTKYGHRINEDISFNSKSFSKDSLNRIFDNFYFISMNPKLPVIRDNFDKLLNKVDSLNYIDSIYISTRFGKRIPEKLRITFSNYFPFELTKQVLSFFYDKNIEFRIQYEDYRTDLFDEYLLSRMNRPGRKKMTIGSFEGSPSKNKRYISKKEIIAKLISSESRTEFEIIAREYDEHKERYQKYLKSIEPTLRIKCCEEIPNMEVRIKNAKDSLNYWIEKNIIDVVAIPKDGEFIEVFLAIDKDGKIKDKKVDEYRYSETAKQVLKILDNLPLFVPPMKNYSPHNEKKLLIIFDEDKRERYKNAN